MAQLILGIGTSHGPMLHTPVDQWHLRVGVDRARQHAFRGGTHSFDELVAMRSHESLAEQCALPARAERLARCTHAIARLRDAWVRALPDLVVLVGNDQMEIFTEENQPTFAVHYGDSLENVPYSDEQKAHMQPGLAIAEPGHHGEAAESFPGHHEFALHLISTMLSRGFDPATLQRLPVVPSSYSKGIPHAYGFVYRQIMAPRIVPAVLVFVNTFYPPNQPSAARCFNLGSVIADAIRDWPSDLRVAVIGSGGMTHFAVDEELDMRFLSALRDKDPAAILEIPDHAYRSGTSELKNWIPLGAAMQGTALEMKLVDYVPCYRSIAGTGSGMAFATWSAHGREAD